jgi:hypothetical protein
LGRLLHAARQKRHLDAFGRVFSNSGMSLKGPEFG